MKRESPPLDEEALSELASRIAHVSDPAVVRALLDELLTPAERRDLALRWRLMRRLSEGIPQRTIARELGISLCKITRGSGVLRNAQSVCRRLLNLS